MDIKYLHPSAPVPSIEKEEFEDFLLTKLIPAESRRKGNLRRRETSDFVCERPVRPTVDGSVEPLPFESIVSPVP